MTGKPTARRILGDIWAALEGNPALLGAVRFDGEGSLPSAFAVSDLAAGAVAAAGLAIAEYAVQSSRSTPPADVTVNRPLASFWFGWSFQPIGWTPPAPWDPVAGDYQATDGWVRLHTNAPHHRAAALSVLGTPAERDAVATAVRHWKAGALEAAVLEAGGCAAAMRPMSDWAAHSQGRAVAAEPIVWCEGTAPGPAAASPDRARPLAGLRVLDLTRVLAGPVCTRVLAGLGAEVLRTDPPSWDEPGVAPEVTLG